MVLADDKTVIGEAVARRVPPGAVAIGERGAAARYHPLIQHPK
jgi:hypothetical protein